MAVVNGGARQDEKSLPDLTVKVKNRNLDL